MMTLGILDQSQIGEGRTASETELTAVTPIRDFSARVHSCRLLAQAFHLQGK